ncbi:MAG: glycine zipper family protein [Bacteroidales bacterium]|nr:glycine zipper family protein [Bacteroidales bacterium]
MKKSILILLFIACQLYTWSQVKDKIITKNGETFICRIDSITSTHIYFATVVRNSLVQTYIEMSKVRDYQPYILSEDFIDSGVDFTYFPQDNPFIKKRKNKTYKTWVTFMNNSLKFKGVLYEVNDSSITLSSSVGIDDYFESNYETMTFQVNNIKMISTRKKNNTVRGIWIGAVSGFGSAFLAGLIAGEGNTFFFSIPMAAIGAGVGAIIGSVPIGIHIHGDMNRYYRRRKMLEKRSLK